MLIACLLLMGNSPLRVGPEVLYQATLFFIAIAGALFSLSLISSMYLRDWKKRPAIFLFVFLLNFIPLAAVALFIWLCFNLVI